MIPYRVKYTESESDIKNSNWFYKNTQKVKILSVFYKNGNFQKSKNFKNSHFYLVLCIRSIIHILLSIFLFWKISKMRNVQKLNFLFGIMFTFHNSCFLYFYILHFYIFIFWYFYIFILLYIYIIN